MSRAFLNTVLAVFQKELVDGLRDRRALFSLLLFPLIGPLLAALMLTQTAKQIAGADVIELAVRGAQHAPALIAHLEKHGVKTREAPADPRQAVIDGEHKLVLLISPAFGGRFRQGKRAEVQIVMDQSRTDGHADVGRISAYISSYSQTVGLLRSLARGVDPDLGSPIQITRIDIATAKKRAALFLNLVPMFVILATFIGGMYTATDATAGERERGSLEPLLITPAARGALVVGKWLVAALLSLVTTWATLLCTLLALSAVPAEKLGMNLTMDIDDVLRMALLVVPLSLMVASCQLLVASFARSFKEAQSYLSLMVLLPMLPAVFLMMRPFKTALWMTFVPVLGQQALFMDIIRGEGPSAWSYAIISIATLFLGVVAAWVTAWLFGRERIIYGR